MDFSLQRPLPAGLVSAFWTILADAHGLVDRGSVIDREGRSVVAVSFDSDFGGLPTRYLLVADRTTGTLLGYEQVLTSKPGKLGVSIPAVISYQLWLAAGSARNVTDTL
ncbi:hypothetical protein [Frankia sp. Cas3]|uniref:hypothetical protein n=1 Tax=Frankia sp. Cas3 TaxID=3073926 RepID=UPI002AD4B032|nr:hypothetical protein [Frankia sp. Cas3]